MNEVWAIVLHERKPRSVDEWTDVTASAVYGDPQPMAPRVGADLRAARERIGWSLQDIARGLRIRGQYLVALEEGRVDRLPGNAYAVGFLRTYAGVLGLDPEELTRRFRAEAAEINRKTELVFPVPVPERGVPAGAVVLLGVVLAIGAYVGWYRLSGNGELPPEVVPPVPSRLVPLAEQAPPPVRTTATPAPATSTATSGGQAPTSGSGTAVAGATTPAPGRTDALAASEPAPSLSPSQAAAATTMPPLGAQTLVPAPPPVATPAPDQARIVLSASADAWLFVRDKSGQVLLNRVLHPGETWSVPAVPNLTLTTGNAGGTDILVDGAAITPLGGAGAVRRDIPLDPDLLKSGKLGSMAPPITTASSGPAVVPKSSSQ